jgi:hypothetical protein
MKILMCKKLRHNSVFSFRWLILVLIFAAGTASAQTDIAPTGTYETNWLKFDTFIQEQTESDTISAYSYLISGGLATVGGIIGYANSQDQFAKVVYAVSQSIGIAAMGYGGFQLVVGNEHRLFHSTLSQTQGLSDFEKNRLVSNYFKNRKIQEKKSRTVKAITHGLVAILNFVNAAQENNSDLKTALYFVGGVNALASISFSF